MANEELRERIHRLEENLARLKAAIAKPIPVRGTIVVGIPTKETFTAVGISLGTLNNDGELDITNGFGADALGQRVSSLTNWKQLGTYNVLTNLPDDPPATEQQEVQNPLDL